MRRFAFANPCAGASILEVLLAMAVVAIMAPFMYSRISETSAGFRDISVAHSIVAVKTSALNFVRLNHDKWPMAAQIRLDDNDLGLIAPNAYAGFIDKYPARGASIADVYLAFEVGDEFRAANIANAIGPSAATVNSEGVAFGGNWAASAPDFKAGDLVVKISRDFGSEDTSNFLHRGTSGEDNFTTMERNLSLGGKELYGIGTHATESGKSFETIANFVTSKRVAAVSGFFSAGANLDATDAKFGAVRVTGDITGFRNIAAMRFGETTGFATRGTVIADRAVITETVRVGSGMTLVSSGSTTVSGFAGMSVHSLYVPYVYSDEMTFANGYGLTVSSELLSSSNPGPIKLGAWSFPVTSAPRVSELELVKTIIPREPSVSEFDKIIVSGWRSN